MGFWAFLDKKQLWSVIIKGSPPRNLGIVGSNPTQVTTMILLMTPVLSGTGWFQEADSRVI